ncbi:hypothetical protein [Paenibacillus odorifer]|uniref:hypothetical protein n=1 Tax=Paenibacillus odorifer TaxID=189426 RepID=UPI0004F8F62E|nr:hypothetical protein [Paenibacillus odorifer]AIQ75997.1 hypothetical protein PODO_23625 [Paenibacillus odorifer]OME53455.1 hypothetical protein BSK61_17025 [Paenibacillus odorifer]
MSWIYIIAVIIFAIVSNVNKATKNKPKGAPRGGMPTFGGGEDSPLRRVKRPDIDGGRQAESGSGFPAPVNTSSRQSMSEDNREYEASPAFPEPAYIPTPDYSTGEGMSLEHADDGVELRTQRMQEEVRRLQSAFDGIAGADSKRSNKTKNTNSPSAADQTHETGSRDDLRNGVVWAEILGPPRSRQPHSTRR